MATQLTFDFSSQPWLDNNPIITKDAWLDVSEIARGVGFVETVLVSLALRDALEYQRADYDQLLYDALWLTYLKLSLDQSQFATFNFVFPSNDWKVEKIRDVSLRLRAEAHKQVVLLGLLSDF